MVLFHPKYIFDSRPFIDLKNYPGDVFTSLWVNFTQMINDGEILSSSEVFRELEDYDDEIANWAKQNKKVFIKPTLEEQIEVQLFVTMMLNFPFPVASYSLFTHLFKIWFIDRPIWGV